jgi:hypothetical protein
MHDSLSNQAQGVGTRGLLSDGLEMGQCSYLIRQLWCRPRAREANDDDENEVKKIGGDRIQEAIQQGRFFRDP